MRTLIVFMLLVEVAHSFDKHKLCQDCLDWRKKGNSVNCNAYCIDDYIYIEDPPVINYPEPSPQYIFIMRMHERIKELEKQVQELRQHSLPPSCLEWSKSVATIEELAGSPDGSFIALDDKRHLRIRIIKDECKDEQR